MAQTGLELTAILSFVKPDLQSLLRIVPVRGEELGAQSFRPSHLLSTYCIPGPALNPAVRPENGQRKCLPQGLAMLVRAQIHSQADMRH